LDRFGAVDRAASTARTSENVEKESTGWRGRSRATDSSRLPAALFTV